LSQFGRCAGPGLHLGRAGDQFQYSDLGGGRNARFFVLSLREDPQITMPAPGVALKVLVARPNGRVDRGWTFVPSNYTFVSLTYPHNFDPVSDNGWDQRLRFGVYTVLVETLSGEPIVCSGFVNLPPRSVA
jgi:hypothetical protein